MNIVVIGGGTAGHFGNDFVLTAKSVGHDVRVLSHKPSSVTNSTMGFTSVDDAVNKFRDITSDMNTIDILLYNSTHKGYPNDPALFTSRAVIKDNLYIHGFYIQVIIPHALCVESLKKMDETSKIFFMTTDVIYDRERTEDLNKLGYYGGKAYQHQLMLGLSEHNDKGVTVSSISPYFDYENKVEYRKKFDVVYQHIFGGSINGKVYDCWD